MNATVYLIGQMRGSLEKALKALDQNNTELARELVLKAHIALLDLVDEMLLRGEWEEREE